MVLRTHTILCVAHVHLRHAVHVVHRIRTRVYSIAFDALSQYTAYATDDTSTMRIIVRVNELAIPASTCIIKNVN